MGAAAPALPLPQCCRRSVLCPPAPSADGSRRLWSLKGRGKGGGGTRGKGGGGRGGKEGGAVGKGGRRGVA